MKILTAGALALLVLSCSSGSSKITSPKDIGRDIEGRGARVTIEKLQASGVWNSSLEKIEQGDSDWLAVAALLRAGADASAAVDLDYSVALALKNNPRGVLRLLEGPFGPADVCTIPYIEAPREVELRHLEEADRALKEVPDEALAEPRRRCAEHLSRIREMMRR